MININPFNVVVHYWSFQGDVELRGEMKGEMEDEVKSGVKVHEIHDNKAIM